MLSFLRTSSRVGTVYYFIDYYFIAFIRISKNILLFTASHNLHDSLIVNMK